MVNGGFAYGHLFMSQHENTPQVFLELLEIIRPYRVLEIGTFHGGLTLMLRDILDNLGLSGSIIRTYDINDQEFLKPLVKDRLVEVYTKNVFDKEYKHFADYSAEKEIAKFIQQDGCTLVLCDGGCKKCEFNLIAPYLKIDDIIMAHDYAPNEDVFRSSIEGKIWDWMEIEDKDIEIACKTYNLIPYYQEIAQQAAWLSRVKS